jgi:hypothetical protein
LRGEALLEVAVDLRATVLDKFRTPQSVILSLSKDQFCLSA